MVDNNFWTYEEISRPHIKLFRITALLPLEGRTFDYIGTKILSVYLNFIIFSYNTMFLGYGLRMALRKDFEIDYITEQFVVGNISFRYMLLFLNRNKFVKLMKMCKEIWSFIKPNETTIVRSFERQVFYIWNFILLCVFANVTAFIASAQIIRLTSHRNNETELKVLPFRFYVNVQQEPYFTIVSIFQGIVTYSTMIVDTGIESAPFYLIFIGCGYLKSLRVRLLSLMESQDKMNQKNGENFDNASEVVYKDVRMCVIFHQKLMSYCEEIERFMRSIYFVGIFTTVYNMSMLGIYLLKGSQQKFKYITLFLLNVLQFFSYQWGPEYLLMESEGVAHAAYFASLKQLGQQKETNNLLLLLIVRAQKPIQLTAGGFQKLSMETFASMVKNAGSFFAVLRNFEF